MREKLLIILRVALGGVLVGLIISLFQYLTELVIHLGAYLASSSVTSFIILYLAGLIIYAILFFINRRNPGHYGSGIPQLEAQYDGIYQVNPFKMLPLIFINSLYSFFIGLPLGAEGPSITISSSIGLILNKLFKVDDNTLAMACGSSGFACAFSNPIAGICHLIEENKKDLSLGFIIKGIAVLAIAYLINYFIIDETLLPYFSLKPMPPLYYLYLILVIGFVLLISKAYSISILWLKGLSRNNRLVFYLTPLLIILFITLRRFMPLLTGSGLSLLKLDTMDYLLIAILSFLMFRVLTTALAVSSSVSGGIVLPMLCMGGLVGLATVKLIGKWDSNILEYSEIFMLVGMFSFLGVLTRCPFTALALGLGCGSLNALALPLILTIAITFIASHFLKYNSIYYDLKNLFLKGISDDPLNHIANDEII